MSADERLAIWRYATPEERQRVIDGEWGTGVIRLSLIVHDHSCCPWGAALGGYDTGSPMELPGWPSMWTVARHIGREELTDSVGQFMRAWDTGQIARDDLIAHLRQLNAQDAAQPGQASIALAWGALWLALVITFALIAAAIWGAAWITGAWLAPFGG